MPADKKSLVYARIVYRLLTNPRGWRVDQLKEELEIADRTYRHYRQELQSQFRELQRQDGRSLIQEVVDGNARYLRIVDGRQIAASDPDYLGRIAALYFAQRLLGFVQGTEISEAVSALVAEYEHRVKDKRFDLGVTLRNVDRMFFEVPGAPKDYSEKGDIIRACLRGLVFTRKLQVLYDSSSWDGAFRLELRPYTLAAHRSALYLIACAQDYDDPRYYAVDRLLEVNVTNEKFEYPHPDAYHPETWCQGGFGLFRGDGNEACEFELVFANKRWLKAFLRERRWSPTQQFDELEDGRLRMVFTTSSDVQVRPWIRSFGEDVEVIRPEWDPVAPD